MVVIEGSEMCNGIIKYKEAKDRSGLKEAGLPEIIEGGRFLSVNANSEDVAQMVHLALCITL